MSFLSIFCLNTKTLGLVGKKFIVGLLVINGVTAGREVRFTFRSPGHSVFPSC